MVVLLHVLIALSSLALATYTVIKPARAVLFASYGSIVATIISGVYLVWAESSRMLHTCEVGLVYLVVVSAIVVAARTRLVRGESRTPSL